MVVVDTSVLVDWDRGLPNAETNWLRNHLRAEEIAITDLILCEALRGCRDDAQARRLEGWLALFRLLHGASPELARDAAAKYRTLRQGGITVVSIVDCLTAAFCLREGHSLLHRDHDYDAFEEHFGLMVIHPDSARA